MSHEQNSVEIEVDVKAQCIIVGCELHDELSTAVLHTYCAGLLSRRRRPPTTRLILPRHVWVLSGRCDVVSCELARRAVRRGPTAYSIMCRRDDNRGRQDLDRSDRNRISYVYRLSASLPTNVDSPRDPAARPCTSLPPAAQLTDTRARPSDNAHVMPGPACTGRGRRVETWHLPLPGRQVSPRYRVRPSLWVIE